MQKHKDNNCNKQLLPPWSKGKNGGSLEFSKSSTSKMEPHKSGAQTYMKGQDPSMWVPQELREEACGIGESLPLFPLNSFTFFPLPFFFLVKYIKVNKIFKKLIPI